MLRKYFSFVVFYLCVFSQLAYALEHTEQLDTLEGAALLIISGAIEKNNVKNEAHFSRAMLEKIPIKTFHTTTLVTDGVKRFDGVLMRDLLERVGISKNVSLVDAVALNDYTITIPIADFYNYDVLLATHMDGKELLSTDKGPLWIVYPRDSQRVLQDIRYDYRWVWQLKHLHLH